MTGELVFDDVEAGYGPYRALLGLRLAITATERVALLGHNGAGKSTVARVASGLVPVTSGQLTLFGRHFFRHPSNRTRAGLWHLPEGVGLFGTLSLDENIELRASHLPRARRRAMVATAYELIGSLAVKRHQRARELSGGQQRLVAAACAVAATPRLLIADEPTIGLSPAAAADVYGALASLPRETTLLIIETSLDRVESLCDRAVVMNRGRVLVDGDWEQARRALRTPFHPESPS